MLVRFSLVTSLCTRLYTRICCFKQQYNVLLLSLLFQHTTGNCQVWQCCSRLLLLVVMMMTTMLIPVCSL